MKNLPQSCRGIAGGPRSRPRLGDHLKAQALSNKPQRPTGTVTDLSKSGTSAQHSSGLRRGDHTIAPPPDRTA
jgi:hypothetical protein